MRHDALTDRGAVYPRAELAYDAAGLVAHDVWPVESLTLATVDQVATLDTYRTTLEQYAPGPRSRVGDLVVPQDVVGPISTSTDLRGRITPPQDAT